MNTLKREHPTCFGIALGSNLGNRLEQFRVGLEALLLRGDIQLLSKAAVYETDPVDCPPGSQAFLNTVIEVESSLDAHALHQVLQQIEIALGRPEKRERNSPRSLDLDILYAGDQCMDDEVLTIPHPRLHQRRFVLQPLADIRPELVLPGQQMTVGELLALLRDEASAVRLVAREW
jgi:2-amino-4-hydroxy-6-hydroxymethyldihydropteridine diphosphokinase